MKFFLLSSLAGTLLIVTGGLSISRAEIAPDSTLPQASRVNRAANRTVITGGTRRGSNQFHSLREFSVPSGEIAAFQDIEPTVRNLFVRVTGRNQSRINGRVEVLDADQQVSAANLFLLNPNGIHFGPNALLRLGGSFVATTADGIRFADGSQFSAVQPQSTALLSVSTPVGLQMGRQAGPIVNRSLAFQQDQSGNPLLDRNGAAIQGLSAGARQTLALVGGNITMNSGQIYMADGRVELGSVTDGFVALTPVQRGWDLDFANAQSGGNLQLRNTSGIIGRDIQLQGSKIAIRDFSFVTSGQPGGDIDVTATDSVTLQTGGNLFTLTFNNQRAGNVAVSTGRLWVEGGSSLGSQTTCRGFCPNGQSGNVDVVASDQVVVSGTAGPPESDLSQIFNQSIGDGDTGRLTIQTNRLQVQSGGQVNATASSTGNAGDMTIQANQIDLIGLPPTSDGRPLFAQGLPLSGGLFVGTAPRSRGNGGTLRITTEQLRVQDGAILQASTYGAGNAGNIVIRATDLVEVVGVSERGNIPSRITATSGGLRGLSTSESQQATGRGGNLTLLTDRLRIEDQGIIAVNSLNPNGAGAGSIQITANQITLNNRGQLNAQTESGDNPNLSINLEGVEILTLRGNSEISTSAGVQSDDGNGGNININADVILDAPAENSDISANAGRETAGNIRIDAQGILGIQEQARNTPRSDITATAESGVDGEILINSPTLNPTQGIVELPSTIVDASRLIAQGCEARQRTASTELGEFVITGRGGVPPTPTDLRSSSAVITDWARLDSAPPSAELSAHPEQTNREADGRAADLSAHPERTNRETDGPATADRPSATAIVEAQGWRVDREGRVALVAQAGAGTASVSTWTAPACREP